MKKVIFIVFLLFLLIELSWAIFYINKNSANNQLISSILTKIGLRKEKGLILEDNLNIPFFELSPRTASLTYGEEKILEIKINSPNKTLSGADVVLLYDPEFTEPIELLPGDVFPDYPLLKINKEKSKISITGTMTNPSQKPFIGNGIFAKIKVRFLKEGETKLKFDFYPGSTADSNLTEKESGKDILETVYNGSYTIIKK